MSETEGEVTIETHKGAVTIPVSLEAIRDVDGVRTYVARALDDSFDRWLYPWKHPDRLAWPEFVPLPRLAAWVERQRKRRQRARDAWSVLRGRDRIWTEEDEQW